jgi:uncharacterized damage-inducible protein DinB
MNVETLRSNLVELLEGGSAHGTAEAALADLAPELRAKRPAPGVHSVWDELEHMRLAQEDILKFTTDGEYKSPDWPAGYWSPVTDVVDDVLWDGAVTKFFSNLDEIIAIVENPAIDLTAEIPHGEGRTYLREVLLVADHNAYHLGQIVQTRKLLGAWGK